ncbi:MAG: YncE family protein, partial [Gemmatimonadaceae bacterium]
MIPCSIDAEVTTMRRQFLISGVLALVLVACGTATPTTAPSPAPPTVAPTAAPAQPAAIPTTAAAPKATGDRLYVRDGNGVPANRLSVIDAGSGTRMQDLPLGVPSPDWSTLYVTERGIEQTTVRAFDPQTGKARRETTITGRFALPEEGVAGTPRGLSPNGRWLALSRGLTYAATTTSHLAVIDTAFAQPPKYVDLDGDFSFDALSNDGTSLYLIEALPPTGTATPGLGYKVRLYDLNTATLQPGVVVDKTAIAETMSGTRQSAVASPDGQWVYSLYLNEAKGPFIHMLNLNGRYAICVFLPTTDKENLAKQLLWSLAQTRDGQWLYAVNGALGIVSEVDPNQLQVRRTVTLPMAAASAPGIVAR